MPVNKVAPRVLGSVSVVVALGMGATTALADPSVQPELETVREMLKLDTERALAAERAKSPPPAPVPAAAPAQRDRIEVTSIYGMRGRLSAVVVVNGEPRLYRQGSEWPRGSAGNGQYRLQRIEDGCVHLAKAGARSRTACFPLDIAPRPAAPAAIARPASVQGLPVIPPFPSGDSHARP